MYIYIVVHPMHVTTLEEDLYDGCDSSNAAG